MSTAPSMDRQSGAVQSILIIILLIVAIGTGFFAYVQFEEAKKARLDRADALAESEQARANVLIRDQLLEDLSKTIGETGTWNGREGFNWTEYGGQPSALQNVTLPSNVNAAVSKAGNDLKVPASLQDGLTSLFTQIQATVDSKDQQIASLRAQNQELLAQKNAADRAASEVSSERSREVSQLNQQHNEFRQTIDAQLSQKDQRLIAVRQANDGLRDELEGEKTARKAEVLQLTKEKNNLIGRIQAQADRNKLRNPPQMPDGEVISSSQAANAAFIDLGRKHMLPVGTVFEVKAPGKDEVKAIATVTRVEQDRAMVEISDLKDRFDPVVRGDLISNALYSPNMRRNIFLMGRFSHPYSRAKVKLLLENLGNSVSDELTPAVDLIVVGQDSINEEGTGFTPITETDAYKQGQAWGIEMASLHKVRPFLRLEN